MIKGIAHVAFYVSNMEKSLNFYSNKLGFKKMFELKDDNGNQWINYLKITETQFLELFYGNPELNDKPAFSHFCLEVKDINEIANKLKSQGIIPDVEPKQGKDTDFQCWIKDLDGNRIEFMQILK